MVRDTGFEPVTPTVSRYSGLLDSCFFSIGDSIWSHANPCRNGKRYSEMLRWGFSQGMRAAAAGASRRAYIPETLFPKTRIVAFECVF
jgi:hypothetical protein